MENSKNSFIAIFLTAIGLTLIAPLFIRGFYADFFSQASFNLLILFTIYTLSHKLSALSVGMAFVIPFLIFDWASMLTSSLFFLTLSQVIICFFLLYAIYYIAKKVVEEPVIDTNLVFGAIMIYLLVGILWSKFYWLTEVFIPNSFKGLLEGEVSFETAFHDQFDLFYYSFTTMGTLGLGDISPTSNLAKALTALQAIFGHLFLATVIAKLVSVWRRGAQKVINLTGEKLYKANQRNQSLLVVFILLLAIVFVPPSLIQGFYSNLFLQTCFNLLIIFMVYTLSNERLALYLGVGLAIPFVVLEFISIFYSSLPLLIINQAILCLFLIYASYYIIKKVLREPIIDTNLIFGAIIIYFLIGILWSKFYWLAEMLSPGSFRGITPVTGHELLDALQIRYDLFYFSFTTVAALGLGDITPASHLGKSLTILEALFGQFFVATIIAKMVMVWRTSREIESKDLSTKATASMVEKIKRSDKSH